MTPFDPQQITPPPELKLAWAQRGSFESVARWGAQQAADALRHEWPTPITDRAPTEADGDALGYVHIPSEDGRWDSVQWDEAADERYAWLHCPGWRDRQASPDRKSLAMASLTALRGMRPSHECHHLDNIAAALALVPDDAGVGE